MRRAALALSLAFLLAAPAFADIVRLKDGQVLEGELVERNGKLVVIVRKGVEIEVDRTQVVAIERSQTAREELEKRRRELVPGDPDVLYELAQWCKKAALAAERREILEAVLKLDPDHAAARADLGYVKDDGRWILEDDLRRKLGYEKWNGKWLPADEVKKLRRGDELEKLLLAIAFKLRKPDQAQAARAQLDALKDPPEVLQPLFEKRLDDHDAEVRRHFTECLARFKRREAAPLLLKLALTDPSAGVRAPAARGLWQTGDEPTKTELVQALFSRNSSIRWAAGEALGTIEDPETVPYLIEGLEIQVVEKVEQLESGGSVQTDGTKPGNGLGLNGSGQQQGSVEFGRYTEGYQRVTRPQRAPLVALQKITGRDFGYSKEDWHGWWKREGRAKLLAPKDPPPGEKKPAEPKKQ